MTLFTQQGIAPPNLSTDRRWLFQIEESPDGFLVTHLVKSDGSQQWFVQLSAAEYPLQDDLSLYLTPAFWLPKEPYVFLNGVYNAPCGMETFTLRRLNLRNGLLTTVIPGKVCTPISYSLSHTGRFLLHALEDPARIQLQRLSDGEVTFVRLPFNFRQAFTLSWSPDETRVLLAACQQDSGPPDSCTAQPIFWIDADSAVFHRLAPDLNALKINEGDGWSEIVWLSPNRINLHLSSGSAWEANLVTGQLTCRTANGMPCPAHIAPSLPSEP